MKYDACVVCGKTEHTHNTFGKCQVCARSQSNRNKTIEMREEKAQKANENRFKYLHKTDKATLSELKDNTGIIFNFGGSIGRIHSPFPELNNYYWKDFEIWRDKVRRIFTAPKK